MALIDELQKTIKIRVVLTITAGAVALCLAVWFGWWWRGNIAAETVAGLEEKLMTCEQDQQAAIRDGQEAAGWVALADKEVGELRKENLDIKRSYEDSLRVVRAMLPDAAERAIADHYRASAAAR